MYRKKYKNFHSKTSLKSDSRTGFSASCKDFAKGCFRRTAQAIGSRRGLHDAHGI